MNSTPSAVRVFRTNSLVRNIPDKIKHVLMEMQTKDVKSPSQSVSQWSQGKFMSQFVSAFEWILWKILLVFNSVVVRTLYED
jgi:hypothetical protein